MIKLYSLKKTENIIKEMEPAIHKASEDYHVPEAFIKAILYREIKDIDLLDAGVDMIVRSRFLSRMFHRQDSSTGYGQIYGFVAVNALNFALENQLVTKAQLGLPEDRTFSSKDPEDVRFIWLKLHKDREFNLKLSVLNMVSGASETVGRTDFSTFSAEEYKLAFSRYNANVKKITAYGEEVYGYFMIYKEA